MDLLVKNVAPPLGGEFSQTSAVSIGIPAYNSQDFILETLLSIAGQTYSDIDVLISDDGSTDGTDRICAEFVSHDPRFRLQRQAHIGERRNFNHLLREARGEYFMWAADHDVWHPHYVARCVATLEADKGLVLAYSHSRLIDADGTDLGAMDDEFGIDHASAFGRYTTLIWRPVVCNAIYGVVRREIALDTGGYGPTPGPDHLVLAKLALQGRFAQLPDELYFRRRNRPEETPAELRSRQPQDLDPTTADTWLSLAPGSYYRGLRDAHIRAVLRSGMSTFQKLRAWGSTLACFRNRFGVDSRMVDLAETFAQVLPSGFRRRALGRRTGR